jgi:hypothetical protein
MTLLCTSACKEKPVTPVKPTGDATAPSEIPVDADYATRLQAIAARMPADWAGTGVLERRPDVAEGAPEWAGVVAELVDTEDGRYIQGSGESRGISNVGLARTTAGNRARVSLMMWLGTGILQGAEITEFWGAPGQPFYAHARLRVPPTWQPGQPLPEADLVTP